MILTGECKGEVMLSKLANPEKELKMPYGTTAVHLDKQS